MKKLIIAILIPAAVIGLWMVESCGFGNDSKEPAKVVIREVVKECPPVPCVEKNGEGQGDESSIKSAPPDESILYHLTDKYVPVKFSHKDHTQYSETCEECHHHQSDVEKFPPCRECHGIRSADSLNKPGLVGAYHRQCMNCHRRLSGPMGCESCHAKRENKKETNDQIAMENAPDKTTLGHLSKVYQPVIFDHKLHSTLSDSCFYCHHQQGAVEKTPPCRECHNKAETGEDGMLGLKDAYHNQCQNCHKSKGINVMSCTDCHKKK